MFPQIRNRVHISPTDPQFPSPSLLLRIANCRQLGWVERLSTLALPPASRGPTSQGINPLAATATAGRASVPNQPNKLRAGGSPRHHPHSGGAGIRASGIWVSGVLCVILSERHGRESKRFWAGGMYRPVNGRQSCSQDGRTSHSACLARSADFVAPISPMRSPRLPGMNVVRPQRLTTARGHLAAQRYTRHAATRAPPDTRVGGGWHQMASAILRARRYWPAHPGFVHPGMT